MTARWRRGVRIAAAVGLVGLAAVAVLHVRPARARVLAWVAREIRTRAGVDLEARRLDYNLAAGWIRLLDVRLRRVGPPEAQPGPPPFVEADAIEIDLAPSVLAGRVVFDAVRLVRPRVTIVRAADGRWNLPQSPPRPGRARERRIVPVRRIELDAGTLAYRDDGRAIEGEVRDLALDLRDIGAGVLEGRAEAGGAASVRAFGRHAVIDRLRARIRFDGQTIALEPLTIDASEGTLELTGRIAIGDEHPRVELSWDTRLDASRVAAWWPGVGSISGTVVAGGRVAGPLTSPVATVRLAGELAGGRVVAAARIALAAGGLTSMAAVDYRDLDLAHILAAARIVPPVQLAARLDGRVSMSWDSTDLSSLRLALDNRTDAASRPRPPGWPGERALTLAGHAALFLDRDHWVLRQQHEVDRTITVSSALDGRFVAGDSHRSSIRGHLTVETRNLADALVTLEAAGVGPSPLRTAGLGGPLRARLQVGGTLADLRAKGRVASEAFETATSEPAMLEGRIAIERRGLEVRDLVLRGGANRLDGSVRVAFDRRTVVGAFAAEIRNPSAWLRGVPSTWRPTGTLGVSGRVGGTLTDPTLDVSLAGDDVDIAGQRLGRIDAVARLAKGVVAIERVSVEQASGGRLTGAGRYALDDAQYAGEARLTDFEVGPFFRDETGGAPLSFAGRATGEIVGEGTRARPRGRAHLVLAEVRSGPIAVGPATVDLDVAGEQARVSARAPELGADAEATVGLAPPHRFTLTGRLADADLARWWPRSGPGASVVAGRATIGVEAAGSLDRLEAADVEVSVDAVDVQVGAGQLVLVQPARLRYAGGQLAVADLEFRSGATRVDVSGVLAASGVDSRLAVALAGDLRDLQPFLTPAVALRAEGAIAGTVVATGTLDRPVVAADLAVTRGTVGVGEWPPAHDVDLQMRLRDGVVDLASLAARWQDADLSAEGRFPLVLVERWLPEGYRRTLDTGIRTARLSGRFEKITAHVLEPWLQPEPLAEVALDAGVRWVVETDAMAADRWRGEIVCDRLSVVLANVRVAQQRPTRLEIGGGRLTAAEWVWTGPAGDLTVTGGIGLAARPSMEVQARGRVALSALGVLLPGAAVGGVANLDLRVGGDIASPGVTGTVDIAEGEVRLATPRLVLAGATGRVELADDRLVVRRLTGELNGGRVDLEGDVRRQGWRAVGGELVARVRDAALEWPAGLRSDVVADLVLRPGGDRATLVGRVAVQRGAYREPFALTEQMLDAWRSAAGAPSGGESWLERLRLDVALVSLEDIVVDNNYGQFGLRLDLHVGGTAGRPALTGRTTLEAGGRLYVGGRVYRLERGTIDFVDPSGLAPVLEFSAHTRVASYDVTLTVSGSPGSITAELASDPPLAPGDIVALLLTGQPAADLGLAGAPLVRDQMLAYLSGDLLALAGTRVGFDVVRIERGTADDLFGVDPALVAAEVDPATRLSLVKRLGDQVEVVLSQNLREMGRLTWIALYRPGRGVEWRGISRDDSSRAIELSQRLTLGEGQATRRERSRRAPAAPRIASVQLELPEGIPEAELRRRLGLEVGDRFAFDRWQRGRERLEAWFRARGRLEVRVRADHTVLEGTEPPEVIVTYRVDPGPLTAVVIRGYRASRRLTRALEARWAEAVFDAQVAIDARRLVRDTLARAGYLQPRVTVSLEASPAGERPARKALVVDIEPGPRTPRRHVEFRGNVLVPTERLVRLLRERGLELAPWTAPDAVEAALGEWYANEGVLGARVTTGEPRVEGDRSVVTVTIVEGPQFTIGPIRIEGARGLPDGELRRAFGVETGRPYRPGDVDEGRRAVETAYRRAGYARASVRLHREVDTARAEVAIIVAIDEGPRQVLGDIVIEGAHGRTAALAARALELEPGRPVGPERWVEARRRLYETGVFRSVDLRFDPLDKVAAGAEQRVRAVVTVEPEAPYRVRYGLRVGDELAPAGEGREVTLGLTGELERRHLAGQPLTLGVIGRYERDRALARVFGRLSRLGPWPVTTSAYLTRSRETVAPAGDLAFVTDKTSATAQQDVRLPQAMRVTYGYSFERNHVFDPHADPRDPFALDYRIDVGRLTAAWASDTRDNAFDPTRGIFAASSVEYASRATASDLRFIKLLVQGSAFHRLGATVLAGRVQLGAARGFGQDLVPSERFFAGGASSVRGYAENALGPVDLFGQPAGGNALIVLNGEVRFPVVGRVRGVGFVDAGGVFASATNLTVRHLDVGVGLGARVETPLAMVRVDFGVPVPRRPGRPFGRWYFSLGHAF